VLFSCKTSSIVTSLKASIAERSITIEAPGSVMLGLHPYSHHPLLYLIRVSAGCKIKPRMWSTHMLTNSLIPLSIQPHVAFDATIRTDTADLQAHLYIPDRPNGWIIVGCSRYYHPPGSAFPFGGTELGIMYLETRTDFPAPNTLQSETYTQRTQQVVRAARWLRAEFDTTRVPIGLFGAHQEAEIALSAAAFLGKEVGAVVSYQGRPEKAMNHLHMITAPTLLLVNEGDDVHHAANMQAGWWLHSPHDLTLVSGRSRLLGDRYLPQTVGLLARNWFQQHLLTWKPMVAFPTPMLAAA